MSYILVIVDLYDLKISNLITFWKFPINT